MTETSLNKTVRREDVKRNIPGNVLVKIPYVAVQEESTERSKISIKLPMEPRSMSLRSTLLPTKSYS